MVNAQKYTNNVVHIHEFLQYQKINKYAENTEPGVSKLVVCMNVRFQFKNSSSSIRVHPQIHNHKCNLKSKPVVNIHKTKSFLHIFLCIFFLPSNFQFFIYQLNHFYMYTHIYFSTVNLKCAQSVIGKHVERVRFINRFCSLI